jgi:hypothetical protein
MPGARAAPAALCAMRRSTQAKSLQVSRNIDIPCAMVFDLLRALPGVHDLVSHRRLRITSARLGTSPGAPGPHTFVDRVHIARRATLVTSLAACCFRR